MNQPTCVLEVKHTNNDGVHNSNSVAVYVNNKEGYTKNIVYKEVL